MQGREDVEQLLDACMEVRHRVDVEWQRFVERGEVERKNACLDAWHVTSYAWREAYADIDWCHIVESA